VLSTILLFLSYEGITADAEAGKIRYGESCINCHGPAGKGAASYPKISGKEVSYITTMLETYRDGIEVGPNSYLMIYNAKPLSDVEIANLAEYLKDARYQP
jgi:cytochrome c553